MLQTLVWKCTYWPCDLDLLTQKHVTSKISQDHSISQYKVWTLWDHLFLSYAADKTQTHGRTDRQTDSNILPMPTDIVINLTNVTTYQWLAVGCRRWHQRRRQLARYHMVNVGKRNLWNGQQSCADAVYVIVFNSEYNVSWLVEMGQWQYCIVVLHNHFAGTVRPYDLQSYISTWLIISQRVNIEQIIM